MLLYNHSCITMAGNRLAREVFLFGTTVLELAKKSAQLRTKSKFCIVWFKPVYDVASRQSCNNYKKPM